MPYIQNSEADQAAMLQTLGAPSVDALFESIPKELRFSGVLNIEGGLSESALNRHMDALGHANRPASSNGCFLGGGFYDHDWPALVDHLSGRSEFLTAYTPYQPECSQGTLQAIYEFQSMIAELCGCEVANASMYDGASACAEAALMAVGQKRRKKIVVSAGLHPHSKETLHTYLKHLEVEIVEAPLVDGPTQWGDLIDARTAAVFVQQPNFLGVIEDLDDVRHQTETHGALSIASLYPVATGLLRSPGHAGMDIVVGDGQSLGVPLGLGGPSFGFFATQQKYVRKIPGRLVGLSQDAEGRRAYTLTFQTREQHIRREKATSNICTNNALIALRGCMHMAALGPKGLEEIACLSRQRTLDMVEAITQATDALSLAFPNQAFFNEVTFRAKGGANDIQRLQTALKEEGCHGVLPLATWYEGMPDLFTLACTEKTRPEDIGKLVNAVNHAFQMEAAQ